MRSLFGARCNRHVPPSCGAATDLRANRQKCDCRFCGGHHMMQSKQDQYVPGPIL
ncbi:hypothetical protein BF49_4346 [Bradyrhizobium sp.]|nr:hypothetical protein BF49_4346 [Bradyrhizobium sp.]